MGLRTHSLCFTWRRIDLSGRLKGPMGKARRVGCPLRPPRPREPRPGPNGSTPPPRGSATVRPAASSARPFGAGPEPGGFGPAPRGLRQGRDSPPSSTDWRDSQRKPAHSGLARCDSPGNAWRSSGRTFSSKNRFCSGVRLSGCELGRRQAQHQRRHSKQHRSGWLVQSRCLNVAGALPPVTRLPPCRVDYSAVKQRILFPIASRCHVPLNWLSTD